MRQWSLIVATLLALPGIFGQVTEDWHELAADPMADVETPVGSLAEFDELDITSLEVQETESKLWLRLTTAGFSSRQDAGRGTDDYVVHFQVGEQTYRLLTSRGVTVPAGEPIYQTRFEALDGASGMSVDRSEAVTLVPDEAGWLAWGIAWSALVDRAGVPLVPGDALRGIQAVTVSGYDKTIQASEIGGDPFTVAHDRIPDQGTLGYVIQALGRAADGIVATSPNPVRASNGAPTTFLFPLVVSNFESTDAVLENKAAHLPEGWQAQPLANPLAVAAGQTATTSIAVTTTAKHQHGGNDSFEVHVLSGGQTRSTVPLFVHYTETAQPSGHHPTLAFFTMERSRSNPASDAIDDVAEAVHGFYRNDVFMSTEGERDDRVPVTASDINGEAGWLVPLTPSLGLGLDFTDEVGQALLPLQPSRDGTLTELVLRAVVGLDRQGDWLDLAEGSLDVGDLNGLEQVSVPILRSQSVDVVPYEPGQNMVLKVLVDYVDPTGTGITPNLMPGGSLTMPLEEYQDVVPEDALSSLSLAVESKHQSVNPGERVDYTVTLAGPDGTRATIDALGLPSGWTMTSSQPSPTIGETREILTVQLQAPTDARHGDGVSFFIRATPQDGTAATAAGIQATVTENEDLPDAAALETGSKDSPALGVAVALCAVVVAGAWRKPRHT